jgi:hypothetical protein
LKARLWVSPYVYRPAVSGTAQPWTFAGDAGVAGSGVGGFQASGPTNEALQTPSVTLLGEAATVTNPSGNQWQAARVVDAMVADGPATFSIATADLAGHSGVVATTTTNGSSVTVDKAPVLRIVTISSDNANPRWAKVGDTVTLTFVADEPI